MRQMIYRFMKEESGATAIEYALLAALIGVAIIASATTLGQRITTTFQKIGVEMEKTQNTPAPRSR